MREKQASARAVIVRGKSLPCSWTAVVVHTAVIVEVES